VVREVKLRVAAFALVAVSLFAPSVVFGGGGGNGNTYPNPQPAPASSAQADIHDGALQAGAGGAYEPVTPDNLPAGGSDPANPLYFPPVAPTPNPQGQACPQATTFHPIPGQIPGPGNQGGFIVVIRIFPTFTRNQHGGYDGVDANFGYKIANAIPPGGDPSQVQLGAPVTSATMAGHVIAVAAFLQTRGAWQDAHSTPPYGGYCAGVSFSFGQPYIAGDAPPPPPPATVLNAPPFALGSSLLAEVTRSWNIGTLQTLPGPSSTARTYVHIPTCAWLKSGVPTTPTLLHAIKTAQSNGFTLFLVYNVTVTPGTITWDWGDGTQSTSAGPVESQPATLPSYDPTSQTWTDPCQVSHQYATVSDGRTISASEAISVSITVTWSDGVNVYTRPVPCDNATGAACSLAITPAQGWQSGPHPVDQIEPVPFSPPSPSR
jgi:hypothetical protein